MTFEEKEAILAKSVYEASDLMALEGCSRSKAYSLVKFLRAKGGAVPHRTGVAPEFYWAYVGSSLDEQLRQVGVVLAAKGRGETRPLDWVYGVQGS